MKTHRRSSPTCLLALLLAGLPIMPGSGPIYAVAGPPIDAGHPPGASSSSLLPLGLNFPIALHTGQDGVRGKPGVAFDGTHFVVPWSEGSDVYGARVSPEGNVLDSPPITISHGLNEAVAQPSIAFDGTHYFLAWLATRSGVNEVYGARVTPGGDVLDPAGIQITTGGDPRIRMPAIAFDGTDFLVAWRTRSDHIYGARVSPAGTNLDAPAGFPIAQVGTSYYPAVAFDGTNYLVVWHDSRNARLSGWDVFGARVTPQGQVLDPNGFVICDDPQNQEHTTVAFDGTNYLVAWYDWRPNGDKRRGSAYGARVSPAGSVLDAPAFQVTDRARGEIPVQVTCDGTDCLVVWSVDYGEPLNFRLTDVYGRRVSQDGAILDRQGIPLSTSFGHQFGPVLGYGAGRYLVAWSESTGRNWDGAVYGQLLQRQAAPGTAFDSLSDVPRSPGETPRTSIDWTHQVAPIVYYAGQGVAFSATNAYTFGAHEVYHYAGQQWQHESRVDQGFRYGAWASGPGDIWATGWCRGFHRYDGHSWADLGCYGTHPDAANIATGVWGAGPGDLWASANLGEVLRYDGHATWQAQPAGVPFDLADVWGTASDDVYAAGERGSIVHYDGMAWTPLSGIPTVQTLNAIWGSGTDDIFAGGDWGTILHYDGATWNLQVSGTTEHLADLWGVDGSDVYAVGLGGTILHYDGNGWQAEASGTSQDLLGVWGTYDPSLPGYVIWAAGTGPLILTKTVYLYDLFLPLVQRNG